MVDTNRYNFKYLADKIFKPEESFINLYIEESFESYITIKSTIQMHIILDGKYKNSDLNKDMT